MPPVRQKDAQRALELLQQYRSKLGHRNQGSDKTDHRDQDQQLQQSLDRVITVFQSQLFNALLGSVGPKRKSFKSPAPPVPSGSLGNRTPRSQSAKVKYHAPPPPVQPRAAKSEEAGGSLKVSANGVLQSSNNSSNDLEPRNFPATDRSPGSPSVSSPSSSGGRPGSPSLGLSAVSALVSGTVQGLVSPASPQLPGGLPPPEGTTTTAITTTAAETTAVPVATPKGSSQVAGLSPTVTPAGERAPDRIVSSQPRPSTLPGTLGGPPAAGLAVTEPVRPSPSGPRPGQAATSSPGLTGAPGPFPAAAPRLRDAGCGSMQGWCAGRAVGLLAPPGSSRGQDGLVLSPPVPSEQAGDERQTSGRWCYAGSSVGGWGVGSAFGVLAAAVGPRVAGWGGGALPPPDPASGIRMMMMTMSLPVARKTRLEAVASERALGPAAPGCHS
ncbi:hypothetical protein CRUP_024352 [Coryphaenoides rupestris]|nr:hypothetical protein CRUP_024352 [Coryphaenoides rupestris]